MKIKIFFILLLIFGTGCASYSSFIKDEPDSFAKLNSELRGRKVDILLTDGRSFIGQNTVVTENLTTWLDPKLGRPKSIPTVQLEVISIRIKKGRSGLGLVLGALAGGVTGYVILTKTGENDCRHTSKLHLCAGNELGALLSVILGAGAGYGI